MREPNRIRDSIHAGLGRGRSLAEQPGIAGFGVAEVIGPDGVVKQTARFANLITQVGDQYYGERAAGITSPPDQVTGMQLGEGTTAVAKTGAGAAIVTYISGSDQANESGFPASTLETVDGDDKRQIRWRAFWDEGEATNNTINEVVLVNRTLDGSAATEAQTIARALFDSTIDKGASDTLRVTWDHHLFAAPPA